jgi:hypothetical protein
MSIGLFTLRGRPSHLSVQSNRIARTAYILCASGEVGVVPAADISG